MRKIIVEIHDNCTDCQYYIGHYLMISECMLFERTIEHNQPCQQCLDATVKEDNYLISCPLHDFKVKKILCNTCNSKEMCEVNNDIGK